MIAVDESSSPVLFAHMMEGVENRLKQILEAKDRKISEDDERFALEALNNFPQFAKQKFPSPTSDCHAFISLVYRGAKLETLTAILDLFPDVLSTELDDRSPLSWAVQWRGNDVALIEFLAASYPPALLSPELVLVTAAQNNVPECTIQALLNITYDNMDLSESEQDLFSLVYEEHGVRDLLDTVAEHILTLSDAYTVHLPENLAVERNESMILEKLKPYLREFTLICDTMTLEGQLHFWKSMRFNKSIHKLKLQCQGMEGYSEPSVLEAFQRFLIKNDVLEHLDLSFDDDEAYLNEMEDFLLTMWRGLAENKRMKGIRVSNLMLNGTAPLRNILLNTGLHSVNFHECYFDAGSETLGETDWNVQPAMSPLKEIRLDRVTVRDLELSVFLRHAIDFPYLETLHVSLMEGGSIEQGQFQVDFTPVICDLLDQGRLKSLELSGLTIDHAKICKCLEQNTTLTVYKNDGITKNDSEVFVNLLKDHNLTLQEVGVLTEDRREAKSGEIPTSSFVNLLCAPLCGLKPGADRDELDEPQPIIEILDSASDDAVAESMPTDTDEYCLHECLGVPNNVKKRKIVEDDHGKRAKYAKGSEPDSEFVEQADEDEADDESFYWDDDEDIPETVADFTTEGGQEKSVFCFEGLYSHPLVPLNIQYGLLSQCPALWLPIKPLPSPISRPTNSAPSPRPRRRCVVKNYR